MNVSPLMNDFFWILKNQKKNFFNSQNAFPKLFPYSHIRTTFRSDLFLFSSQCLFHLSCKTLRHASFHLICDLLFFNIFFPRSHLMMTTEIPYNFFSFLSAMYVVVIINIHFCWCCLTYSISCVCFTLYLQCFIFAFLLPLIHKFHFFFLSCFHSDVSFYFIIYLHTGGLFDDDLDTQIAFRYAVKKTGELSMNFDTYRKLNAGNID